VQPAGAGELLVTNVVNRATVFLRYRSGDRAVLDTAGDRQSLSRLSGPEPQQIEFAGSALPAGLLSTRLGLLPGVGDFQLETGPGHRPVLRWSADSPAPDPSAVRAALTDALAELVPGERPSIEQVGRITPPGGKKRRFVGAAGHRSPV
ncbi:MAG TPA: hypothetical protein VFU36_04755, partial [Jatrophihabitans sp.]|nr:hypothetical protein [Jatrophihabitans sp.]